MNGPQNEPNTEAGQPVQCPACLGLIEPGAEHQCGVQGRLPSPGPNPAPKAWPIPATGRTTVLLCAACATGYGLKEAYDAKDKTPDGHPMCSACGMSDRDSLRTLSVTQDLGNKVRLAKVEKLNQGRTPLALARKHEDLAARASNMMLHAGQVFPKPATAGLKETPVEYAITVRWDEGPDAAADGDSIALGLKAYLESYRDVFNVQVTIVERTE